MTRKQAQQAETAPRTDAEIFAAARRALDNCPTLPGTVRVHVEHGVATLTGTVRLPAERAEAEQAVRPVPGVQHVVNHISMARPISAEGFEPPDELA